MRISDDRASHLAHLIVEGVWKDDLVDYSDDDVALRTAKKGMAKFVKEVADIDHAARKTITSLKRDVQEGTPEWEILYQKYYNQEMQKRGN